MSRQDLGEIGLALGRGRVVSIVDQVIEVHTYHPLPFRFLNFSTGVYLLSLCAALVLSPFSLSLSLSSHTLTHSQSCPLTVFRCSAFA
jgi:hypothetical protein